MWLAQNDQNEQNDQGEQKRANETTKGTETRMSKVSRLPQKVRLGPGASIPGMGLSECLLRSRGASASPLPASFAS